MSSTFPADPLRALPPRSTAGQLTLDQHIGFESLSGSQESPLFMQVSRTFPKIVADACEHCGEVKAPVGTSNRHASRVTSPRGRLTQGRM
jgi:hypothetical protein